MIRELEKRIKQARDEYYAGSPSLTDAEYDALENKLRELDPNNSLFSKIGSEPVTEWIKCTHEIKMGSLNKAQNTDQLNTWLNKYNKCNDNFIITEKLDGISIAVKYINGKFIKALTRGDGITGEDISNNVLKMKGIKKELQYNFSGWLRGEIILMKDDWKKYMPEMKNPRNAAAGTAKRYDGKGCEYLSVLFYNITYDTDCTYDKTKDFLFINNVLKLNTPNLIQCNSYHDIIDTLNAWEENREELNYEIDGMVIELGDSKLYIELGDLNMCPRGAIAYKFKPKQKITSVKSIIWQTGRTGRLTPVAELEPVDIDGITISRVSLHTAKMAEKLQCGPGAIVEISRRNDVIPYVENVLQQASIDIPTENVKWDGDYLVVDNINDNVYLYNSVKTWVERLNILHWGDAFINLLIGYDQIKSLPDIYNLNWDIISSLAGSGIASRAKKSLESNGYNISFTAFISALNIRYCNNIAKNIVKHGINTVDKLLKSNVSELLEIDGIGNTKAIEIRKSIESKRDEIEKLGKIITFMDNNGKLNNMAFCITGSLSKPRKYYQDLIISNGGEYKSSVTKQTTHLITNNPESNTTKIKKAKQLGIDVISEEQFINMV